MKRENVVTAVLAAGCAVAAMLLASPDADAAPGDGCMTTGRPVLLNWIQKRTICDGPRRPDGSWERTRAIWTPAHTTSGSSYCGTYSCSYSPPRSYDESVQEFERYIVFDSNVLPDEPAWLPAGTVIVR